MMYSGTESTTNKEGATILRLELASIVGGTIDIKMYLASYP